MPFDCCYVCANRHVAAVLGAPFADMQPASVFELRLERARARDAWTSHRNFVANHRFTTSRYDRFIRRPDGDCLVGEMVEFLKVGIAKHKAIICIPQDEGFRYGLDGIT